MELQEKKYQYAEKKEQIKRANRFLTLGFLLFYLAMTIVVWIAAIRGIRTHCIDIRRIIRECGGSSRRCFEISGGSRGTGWLNFSGVRKLYRGK